MHKQLIIIYFLLQTLICAKEFSDDKYLQIIAENLEIKNGIINASGDVVAYNLNYYITADKLIYDKNNSTVELFDDVNIIKNNEILSFSNYAFLNINNEFNKFEPFFMLDNQNKLWFNAKKSVVNKDKYSLDTSTISSCDCKDPAWSIGFSKGDYNTTKQWVDTYSTTLYINSIPILYTPYFGFPTDTTRKTGLLKPTLGWSHREGLHYAQPVYFAFKDNYDIEYIPQLRNQRGYGHALKYRYKDSLYSLLSFETSLFKEKDNYQKEMLLENNEHYGFNLNYKRNKLFSKNNSDGLLISLVDMNDVDYINTKYDNDSMDYTNKFLESKIKYFFNTNNYYNDIELKYYNDISKQNNDNILQTLPSINTHKYLTNLIFNKLLYSLDIEFENKTRQVGVTANSTNINIPISYEFSIFDDYLNINFKEQVQYTNIQYRDEENEYSDTNFIKSNHIINIYTDLVKPYRNFVHTVKFDSSITYSDILKEDILVDQSDIDLSYLDISTTNRDIELGINQSIYNNSLKEIVNHKIEQSFSYDKLTSNYKKEKLNNDLSFYFFNSKLTNRLTYDNKIKKIVNSSTSFNFKKDKYYLDISYLNKKDIQTLSNQENINYSIGLKFNKYYNGSYKEEYDFSTNTVKKKEYMLNIDKKCWGINIKLVDSIVATNTTDDSSLRQDILYVEFNLKQLFKLNQVYKFDERNQ
ncbi:MAG: hypothetical protein U9Q20_05365 [Campylobacterota bacterium]|nr:hypothetical protein [Campylobacterota bacterium]